MDSLLNGLRLLASGNLFDARDAFEKAVADMPDAALAHSHLAGALVGLGEMDAALREARHALQLDDDCASAHRALGEVLHVQGNDSLAAWHFKRALELFSHPPLHHWNHAVSVLATEGHALERGKPLTQGAREALLRHIEEKRHWPSVGCPRWDGRAAPDKTLVCFADRGYGDAIQDLRALQIARPSVGRVRVLVPAPLRRLFRACPLIDETVVVREARGDVEMPFAELGRLFPVTHANAYLTVEAADVERWTRRLAQWRRPRVGLVWHADPTHYRNDARSVTAEAFERLTETDGVDFFSVQYRASERVTGAVDLSGEIDDFADAGALLHNLDLLITVDTAAVHLAGALGRPAWLLLGRRADPRWESELYTSVRTFRAGSDWPSLLDEVAGRLAQWVREEAGKWSTRP